MQLKYGRPHDAMAVFPDQDGRKPDRSGVGERAHRARKFPKQRKARGDVGAGCSHLESVRVTR